MWSTIRAIFLVNKFSLFVPQIIYAFNEIGIMRFFPFTVEDSKFYLKSKTKTHEPNTLNVANINSNIDESNLLTVHDVELAKQGMAPQHYDAYVLFADEDINFATEIIEKMEDCGLKVIYFRFFVTFDYCLAI